MSYFVASMHFTKENTEMRVHVNEKGNIEKVSRHVTKEKWHKMVVNWKKAVTQNQYDNEIEDLRKIKETLGGKVSMKSLADILETLGGPENLCDDIKIVINDDDDDDDDDDDTIIIMSDDDDDDNDEYKSSCFMFFSEFHKNNVLNISRLNFESMKFCLSTNVEFAMWLNRKWANTTLYFDF